MVLMRQCPAEELHLSIRRSIQGGVCITLYLPQEVAFRRPHLPMSTNKKTYVVVMDEVSTGVIHGCAALCLPPKSGVPTPST